MNITFIGLGSMGSAMVEKLLEAKYQVTVFNRTPEKAKPLIKLGAKNSDSIVKAVSDADIVMTSLIDGDAVLEVTKTMLTAMKKKSIHVGLSTILPDVAEKLQKIHTEQNTIYISASVLGVPAVAREGGLTTFCAGNKAAIEIISPLLSSFSKEIVPLGDEKQIKAPNLMKICMNYSLMTTIELMSELFIFAEKNSLDKKIVKIALENIYAHPAFKRYIDKIATRDFDNINFTMSGGQKDARIFKSAFLKAGITTELVDLLNQRYDTAIEIGLKDKDWSGIYEVIRKKSNL